MRIQEPAFTFRCRESAGPGHDFRGFQGEIETGSIHVGDEVRILPEGEKRRSGKSIEWMKRRILLLREIR